MRLHGTFGRGGFLHGFYNPVSHELYISDDSNNDYINGYSISGFKIPVKNE